MRTLLAASIAAGLLILSPEPGSSAEPLPGATVEDLLARVRKFNPELAAAALDREAAVAKIYPAGALDDPMVNLSPRAARMTPRDMRLAPQPSCLKPMFPPERIVCLTEETVETLYLLGEQNRIVGISGYCVRPPEARRDKPRVSAFTSANVSKILDLRPDIVLSFSDLQAEIVAALIRRGVAVHAFNQRTITEIFDMIRLLGALVGAADRAQRLADELEAGIADSRRRAKQLQHRPLIY